MKKKDYIKLIRIAVILLLLFIILRGVLVLIILIILSLGMSFLLNYLKLRQFGFELVTFIVAFIISFKKFPNVIEYF